MDLGSIILLGIGLSMDAFTVSITDGIAAGKKRTAKTALACGVSFGIFQAAMPLIGYFASGYFAGLLEKYSNIIAFAILAFLGGKMIYEAFHESDDEKERSALNFRQLILQAVATSIDALAIGVTFALDKNSRTPSVILNCGIIGITTFIISSVGVLIGKTAVSLLRQRSQVFGGVMLILIGLKLLLF